jgi:rsbT co-antagonist protein RsbR
VSGAEAEVRVPLARLQRILEALALASVDAFDDAIASAEIQAEDEIGELEGVLALFLRELQAAKRQLQLTVDEQQRTIQELSTPIIDVWDEILTLPLYGAVDTRRSSEATDRLLQRIVDGQARCVIIDVTGVPVVDTATAEHLQRMVRAAQLLGAYCVLTGIRAEVAQTLIHAGIELGAVKTLRSLKDGLRDCMAYLRASSPARRR